MPRYEITGSGVGSSEALPLSEQRRILKEAGAIRIKEHYHHGWNNQPMTLRFWARSDEAAEAMGDALDDANNPTGRLGGGGGSLRAYGLHWAGYRA